MTKEDAMQLKVGDHVMHKNDPDDRGTVIGVDSAWVVIQWKGDAEPSTHRLERMPNIQRRPSRVSR
jgi:hypothetical protein